MLAEAPNIGRRLLKLLNWNGICDVDFFVDGHSSEVVLLEINARFWGNVVGCASRGVNFPALMCQHALGAEDIVWPKQACGVYCYPKALHVALRTPELRSEILKHPLRAMGLTEVFRDLGPEVHKLYLRLRRVGTS